MSSSALSLFPSFSEVLPLISSSPPFQHFQQLFSCQLPLSFFEMQQS
jgi:hypothetical protein